MLSAGQWKRAVLPLLDDPTTWAFKGKRCHGLSVRWVMSGVFAEGSGFHADHVYVWTLAVPLFVPAEHMTLSQSHRVSPTATFGLDDPEVMQAAIAQALAARRSDEEYLATWADSGPGEVHAYSLVLSGRSAEAPEALAVARALHASDPDSVWKRATVDRLDAVALALDKGAEPEARTLLAAWRDRTADALGISSA